MDVNNLNPNNAPERRLRDADAQQSGATTSDASKAPRHDESAGARSADEVRLSEQARQLRSLEGRVNAQDAFDGERVEAIRTAIAEGRYHVDAERLAERFIELESSLNQ